MSNQRKDTQTETEQKQLSLYQMDLEKKITVKTLSINI